MLKFFFALYSNLSQARQLITFYPQIAQRINFIIQRSIMSLYLCLIVNLLWIPITSASQFHIQLENDAAFGEDDNYSSGLIFGWESKAIPVMQATRGLHNWQQALFLFQHDAVQAWGLKLLNVCGHLMK